MDWDELDSLIAKDAVGHPTDGSPLAQVLLEVDGCALVVKQPGSHWAETTPPGGDFDLEVTSHEGGRPFDASTLLKDFELKVQDQPSEVLMKLAIMAGEIGSAGRDTQDYEGYIEGLLGLPWELFVVAFQCLCLSEHRRFSDLEEDRGGRHLLPELALGVILDLWTADEAIEHGVLGPAGLRNLQRIAQARTALTDLREYLEALEKLRKSDPEIPAPPAPAVTGDRRETIRARALQLLHSMAGEEAEFRAGQWEAIEALVLDKRSVLLVQRTGWGKSAVYLIATKLLREGGGGPTMLISPLLSLMRNQVEMAQRAGIRAETMNSENDSMHGAIVDALVAGEIDILLVSPEWSNKPEFFNRILGVLGTRSPSLIAIDEAHCITDWGHDFRPDYRRVGKLLTVVPEETPVICSTATATTRVIRDIQEQFGQDFVLVRGSLKRPGLKLSVYEPPDRIARLEKIAEIARESDGTGIVYCLTRPATREVADFLQEKDIDAVEYHADMMPEVRNKLEQALLKNEIKVMCATIALGMGFDKPDVAYVIHYQSPQSVIAYYQQVGRAGRGIDRAVGVLMHGGEDRSVQAHFISNAFPAPGDMHGVVSTLSRETGLFFNQVVEKVNLPEQRIEQILKILSVEGVVAKNNGRWRLTGKPFSPPTDRFESVTAQRRKELDEIDLYRHTSGCRIQFLLAALDETHVERCGECDRCTGTSETVPPGIEDVGSESPAAPVVVRPPMKFPYVKPYFGKFMKGENRVAAGRALTAMPGGAFTEQIERSRDEGRYGQDLVDAAAKLIADWKPKPAPSWVTAVPKNEPGGLLECFTEDLAEGLKLPFIPLLEQTREINDQSSIQNEIKRFINVRWAFETRGPCPSGTVLLVDDYFGSGWTVAMAGWALKKSGAGAVIPFALARVLFW